VQRLAGKALIDDLGESVMNSSLRRRSSAAVLVAVLTVSVAGLVAVSIPNARSAVVGHQQVIAYGTKQKAW
jgi:hypothetical protein